MNVHGLLSTKERVRILNSVLFKTRPLSVSEVARETGLSKGLVSKLLNMLAKERILKRNGTKLSVQENLKTKALRVALNLSSLDIRVFERFNFVRGAGLYGSFVKGSNTEESDIDLWVLIEDAPEEALARLTSKLRKMNGKIKPLYLTAKKVKTLSKEDIAFYHSLVFGSINIYGEDIETV